MNNSQTINNLPSIFPNLGAYTWHYGNLPGSPNTNYEGLAGYLHLNAVVSIGLNWISENFFQPDMTIQRGKGKAKGKPVADHALLRLLDKPNPHYDGASLWNATTLSYKTSGNAYWFKNRNGYQQVSELYYLYHDDIVPISEHGDYISYYQYQPKFGGSYFRFAPEDIVHFRCGVDPLDTRIGLSPLRAVLREIVGDNAASAYTAGLLRNHGAVPFLISPKGSEASIDAESSKVVKKALGANVSGDHAGEPPVTSIPVDVTKLGLSPEEMALDKVRNFPEDRICAALGLNTIALGLTSGAGSKTYANGREAVRSCYESCLIPLQTRFAEVINWQLLPELDASPNELRLVFDYSNVPALRENEDAKTKRVASLWTLDLIDKFEARTQLGFDATAADKGVFRRGNKNPGTNV